MIKGLVIPGFVDGGQWSASFGLSWADLLTRDQATSGRIIAPNGMYLREMAGTMGVAEGRNKIVEAFLKNTQGEWLFMVDTDMGFTADTVDRMVASAEANQVPVLGALCFALKRAPGAGLTELRASRYRISPTIYRFVKTEKELGFLAVQDYQRDAFQYADGTGAACLLIHRTALEKVGPSPFRPMLVAGGNPDGTDRAFSEDLSFCARLANAEVPIGVDTSIKTSHYKVGIDLDEEGFLAQQATRKASPLGLTAMQVNESQLNGLPGVMDIARAEFVAQDAREAAAV